MRIKAYYILCVINILTAIFFVIIAFVSNNFLRIVLGLPLILFFPGYTLLSALFPRRESLRDIERFALSFGLSIAVVPLIGLVLNYTSWGIRLYPILISLFIFIFSMSVIGWYRNWKLPQEKSISLHFDIKFPSQSRLWSSKPLLDKILVVVLVITIIGAIGTVSYLASRSKSLEKFTEFYVMNTEGKAENYPSTILLGQSAKVILGIVNHENQTTAYRIEIAIDGENTGEVGAVCLEYEAKWEQEVTITPVKKGDKQKLEFLLYKGDNTNVYESVHLWIDVITGQ